MAANTQFEQNAINQVAQKHQQMKDDLKQQITQLRSEVETTLHSSTSQMTQALDTTYGDWLNSFEKAVLQKVDDLSQAMNTVAGQQQEQDETSRQRVGNSPVGSFLGG